MEKYFIITTDQITFWKKVCGIIIFLLISVISSGVMFYNIHKQQLLVSEQKIEELNFNIDDLQALISRKDKKELMKYDIEAYIKNRFKNTPKLIAKQIAEHVVEFSDKHQVSTELVVGIMEVESGFNPMATSSKNARGLMQVMPEWSKKFGLSSEYDLHDIDTGIESGIKVFKIHLGEADGNVSQGLYYYVNRDKNYSSKVYEAMGHFVSFRFAIGDRNRNKAENSEEVINNKNS